MRLMSVLCPWLPWSGKGKDGKGKDGKSKGKGKDGKGKGKGRSGTNHDNFLDIFSLLSPSTQLQLKERKAAWVLREKPPRTERWPCTYTISTQQISFLWFPVSFVYGFLLVKVESTGPALSTLGRCSMNFVNFLGMFLLGHSKDSRCCMILSHAMSHLFRGVQILLTGTKQTFDDSDEDEAPPPKKKAKAWKDINRIQLWHQSHQTLTDLWELFGHVFYNIWDGPVLFFACKVAKPADDDDEDDEWTGFWVRGLKVQICQSFSPMQRVNQVGPIVQVGSTLSC